MFALGAAAHVADSPDVLFLEAHLVVKNSDAVCLHHKGKSRLDTVQRIAVVVGVLRNGGEKNSISNEKKKVNNQGVEDLLNINYS